MLRRCGLFLLLLSLLWQSVALAGGRWLADDAAHAALHWQDQAHHHHDDGSYHADDSGEALAHVQIDCAVHLTALPGAMTSLSFLDGGTAPVVRYSLHLPSPPPHPLRRPPRTLS